MYKDKEEINHGEKFNINPSLSLKVFLSGPFLTDSAILIQHKNDFILNLKLLNSYFPKLVLSFNTVCS